jgi:hypothetical protein
VSILAVDLAAKYSAACVMDDDGAVLFQFDSWQRSETAFISALIAPWRARLLGMQVAVIEDLPHRLPYSGLTKSVCRLQGRIYQRFTDIDASDTVLFLDPATWRSQYPALKKRGSGPEAVTDVAAELGYSAPADLIERANGVKGGKAIARKVATDYCAAFLIGRWAIHQRRTWDSYDVPGTSRYGHQQMRKPNTEDVNDG